jgi:hypothetical protein
LLSLRSTKSNDSADQADFAPRRLISIDVREEKTMIFSWKKTALAGVAVLSLGLTLTSTPASANDAWIVPGVAAGVLGGLALGNAAANANRETYYAPAPDYDECWIERRPVYDEDGDFVGRRRVRVCR